MSARLNRAEAIASLNDAMRRIGPTSTDHLRWITTQGVMAKGSAFTLDAFSKVATFDAFSDDNDPYGERDFGAFDLGEQRLFWKIDYYDLTMTGGSPDPADPAVTCRVLTVMLAREY